MKKWLALLLAALLSLSFLTACGGDKDSDKDGAGSSSSSQPESKPDPEPEEKILNAGESTVLGAFKITMDSYEAVDEIQKGMWLFQPKEEGNKMFVVNATFENISEEDAKLLPMVYNPTTDVIVKLYYGEGDDMVEYESNYMMQHGDDLHSTTLAPGESKTGILAFEIPQSAIDDTEKPLYFKVSIGKEVIKYNLR